MRMYVNSSEVPGYVAPWTVALQAPLPMEFSRQEYWRGVPLSTQGDSPNPRIQPASLASPAPAGRFFTTAPPGKSRTPLAFRNKEFIPSFHFYSPLSCQP